MTAIQKLTVSHENSIANLEILKRSRADFELYSLTIGDNYGGVTELFCYATAIVYILLSSTLFNSRKEIRKNSTEFISSMDLPSCIRLYYTSV
jgi:hypothetical protein